MNLDPFLDEIIELEPLEQTIQFNSHHWNNYNYQNESVTEKVKFICGNFQNGISRRMIIEFFRQNPENFETGFLLSMIWGHGYGENGRADNRGPWKVSQMFSKHQETMQCLENSNKAINSSNLILAHKSLQPIPRCRVNFFSKFLYFLGKAIGMENYPLIFDARVATSIPKVLSNNDPLLKTLFIQPKQDAKSYQQYVDLLHEISNQNNIEADQLEFFLYSGN